MPVIANCVAKIKADGMASAGDFSIVPTAPRPDAAGHPAEDRTGRADFAPTPKPGLQTPANANATETFSRGNFRIRYDGSKWLIQPEPDGTKWKFTLRGEDAYGIIIPEGLAAQTRAVKEVALNNLRKAAKQSNIVKEETRKVNGKDLLFMHVDATVDEIPLTYYYYIYGDDRGVIQLIAYTTPSKQERYEPAIFDLLNGLEVIR